MALDPVQEIKDRLNIVDVIGQYVKLTKAGKNYKGLSPFRKEKTPSFFVSPDKGMYYDFSSNQGGDIFTFVQAMEGLDFKGALQMLADRAGVEVRHESKEAKSVRERLYACMEDACRFFETKFSENKKATEYVVARGVEPSTLRMFRIGFAPDDWQQLYDFLYQKGYSDHEMERVGLIKRSAEGGAKKRYYDRFRSRIMFPLNDAAGRVIAFSGRIFGEAAKDEKNAKYLNSPETELFNKSRILYGYDKAKQHIRKYDFSILVEGQMDIVMSHQAGYQNTVAVSGTGLTEYHLDLLSRLSPKLVLAFDADSAGIQSTGRAAELALRRGMEVKVATIPHGKDPADCIATNPADWKKAVREAVHVVDFFISLAKKERDEKNLDERKYALRIRDSVLPFIARMPSGLDQAHFVKKVSVELGLGEDAIWQDVRTHARTIAREEARDTSYREEAHSTETPQTPSYTRKEELERELVGFLCWQETITERLEEDTVWRKAESYSIRIAPLLARYSEEHQLLATRAEFEHATTKDLGQTFENLLRTLSQEMLREEQKQITRLLRKAESERDEKKTRELLEQFKSISEKLASIASRAE